MSAPPKATSHGSNAGAGGALRARSAAKAELETIASAVANKATFFMIIPITFQVQPTLAAPPRASGMRLRPKISTGAQWNATLRSPKQKTEAPAAYLGVLPFPVQVVRVCVIPTTILRRPAPESGGGRHSPNGKAATLRALRMSNPI